MSKAALFALATLAVPLAAAAAPAGAPRKAPAITEEERAACQSEFEMVDKRVRLFAAQGLSQAEIDKRNEGARSALAECRQRFAAEQRKAADDRADLDETDRRAGPNATELERERIWRQVRRERLAGRSPSSLTAEEKAELAEGVQAELAETHSTMDQAHARDRAFMRQVHSALACYHGPRREDLRNDLAHEESLVKVGAGDRTRLYALRAELKQADEVLERSREAARGFPDGLARCTEPHTAVLAHCLGIRWEGKAREPACESEEIQQYLRFIK